MPPLALPPKPPPPPPYRAGSLPYHPSVPFPWSPPADFRRRVCVLTEAQQRSATAAARPGQRWGYLTPADFAVLDAYVQIWNPRTGALYPTLETIAARAGVHPDTVCEANKRLRELGILQWLNRRRFDGKQWEQTSNAYWFPLLLPPRNPWQVPFESIPLLPKPPSGLEKALASLGRAISARASPS